MRSESSYPLRNVKFWIVRRSRRSSDDPLGTNGQLSTLWHGLHTVDAEVDENLLELCWITYSD